MIVVWLSDKRKQRYATEFECGIALRGVHRNNARPDYIFVSHAELMEAFPGAEINQATKEKLHQYLHQLRTAMSWKNGKPDITLYNGGHINDLHLV